MSEGLVMVAWPKISLPAPLTDLTDGPSGRGALDSFSLTKQNCNVWNIWNDVSECCIVYHTVLHSVA